VFGYGTQKKKKKKKKTSWLSIMNQTLANGGICQKGFLASSHTTSTAQSGEQLSSHKIYTQKNHHYYGHQTVDVGETVTNYCMVFYGYHRSKCTEDKNAIQKYLSTDTKWEIHLQGQSHFYVKLSQCKIPYKNLVQLKYALSERKGKFCPMFSE
jgi:hypothetical protein